MTRPPELRTFQHLFMCLLCIEGTVLPRGEPAAASTCGIREFIKKEKSLKMEECIQQPCLGASQRPEQFNQVLTEDTPKLGGEPEKVRVHTYQYAALCFKEGSRYPRELAANEDRPS